MSVTPASPPSKQLRRDKDRGMIGGVCAGIAAYFDLDVTLVRIAYVLISIFTAFAGILVYIILWIVVPVKETATSPQTELVTQAR